jgi:hypothetical protein
MSEKDASKQKGWLPEETRQHLRSARIEMRESVRALFPPEFIEHRRAVRREMLLAARTWIDHRLERE